ncbi:PaaI family thioesterase [Williamsia sp. D3]|uniref:PaaI family thioesterase n=1 Tax=Williamsia sp. D3 TaxID=1313067 RepID=UPI0012688E42|nr:PaaI family thioesterase [Williamsia sp. D3]
MTESSGPLTSLAIEYSKTDAGVRSFRQYVGTGLVDHRGDAGLTSVATLAEIVGGAEFYHSQPPGSATVQARLALSMPAPVRIGSSIRGSGRVVGISDGHGVTSAELVDDDDDGRVVCLATGRAIVVSRPTGEMPEGQAGSAGGDAHLAQQEPAPAPLDPTLTGLDILRGLVDGAIEHGPVQRLFGVRVAAVGENNISVAVTPTAGMANQMGTMHGGVVMAAMTEACSLGAELPAAAGVRFRIVDMTLSYFRSPAIDAGELIISVQLIKAGRRIASLLATMMGADGTVLAEATADAAA